MDITAIFIAFGGLAWFGILVTCDLLLRDVSPATCVTVGYIFGCITVGLNLTMKSM